jgi:hypothetical protein
MYKSKLQKKGTKLSLKMKIFLNFESGWWGLQSLCKNCSSNRKERGSVKAIKGKAEGQLKQNKTKTKLFQSEISKSRGL